MVGRMGRAWSDESFRRDESIHPGVERLEFYARCLGGWKVNRRNLPPSQVTTSLSR